MCNDRVVQYRHFVSSNLHILSKWEHFVLLHCRILSLGFCLIGAFFLELPQVWPAHKRKLLGITAVERLQAGCPSCRPTSRSKALLLIVLKLATFSFHTYIQYVHKFIRHSSVEHSLNQRRGGLWAHLLGQDRHLAQKTCTSDPQHFFYGEPSLTWIYCWKVGCLKKTFS